MALTKDLMDSEEIQNPSLTNLKKEAGPPKSFFIRTKTAVKFTAILMKKQMLISVG